MKSQRQERQKWQETVSNSLQPAYKMHVSDAAQDSSEYTETRSKLALKMTPQSLVSIIPYKETTRCFGRDVTWSDLNF